ncbi:MAG: type IV toxin-antitoxin system AbiEi family antitoxin domain-containing protein [Clostridia bacterium]|nr:type IV toxin-antitoxin system AbiEi family antitoxin domain-containing protein [Clostridia bacterium]MBO5435818.1 type IV toxin-antitoxin system AbiEi family antitoxin domain-containing protein [bacterium]
MYKIDRVCETFNKYGGMMRTNQLSNEKIYYKDIQELIKEGYIEKIRTGYYQWVNYEDLSEVSTVIRLFPDGIFCMETALRYYGYSDRTPLEWHIAVNKNSNKTRFNIDYPFVKPYYIDPKVLELGISEQVVDDNKVRMYDKERVVCDCMRYRNKMDREIFNKAIQNYINDSKKNISKLMEYAERLRVKRLVKELIGVWL